MSKNIIADQREVVRMLVARDEMNAAVHMTTVRLSPVTEAAQRVLDFLRVENNEVSSEVIHSIDGNLPHEFIELRWLDDSPTDNPLCAVAGCQSDYMNPEDGDIFRDHEVHRS